MPFIKVNLNGRKYVISGLTERTSSKDILCSLARVDSSFQLETTELSDSSVETNEWNEKIRSSRSRLYHARIRHSSTSSLEVIEWKNGLRGSFSEKHSLKKDFVTDNTKSQEWNVGMCRSNRIEKCSRKLDFTDSAKDKNEFSVRVRETSSEDQTGKREANEKRNEEVKKRKRKIKKGPVSEDVCFWRDKQNENKEMEGKMEIGQKGWKSADDIRRKKCSRFSSSEKECEKECEKMAKNHKTKQSRTSKQLYSHDRKPKNNVHYVFVDAIDKSSECRRVHRNIRRELNALKIQKIVSREVDQRLVDFHMRCWQSQRIRPEMQQQNEEETKRKLIQLINSQSKCLSALNKAEKQNKKTLNRYKKYLQLDKEKLQFYNANFDSEKIKIMKDKEKERRTSDTDHDTGISEQHSDSSTESKQTTTFYDVYKNDVTIDYVMSEDVIKSDSMIVVKDPKQHEIIDNARKKDNTLEIMASRTDQVNKNDVSFDCVISDDVKGSNIVADDVIISDVIKTSEGTSRNVTGDHEPETEEKYSDDVNHDVMDIADNNESTQDVIIIAKQTEIVPFAKSEITSIPCSLADSNTSNTVSDCCFHGNSVEQQPLNIEALDVVLRKEIERQRELKQKLDRLCAEMRLVELRRQEQNKMAESLTSLKNLNERLVEEKTERETDGKSFQKEKKKIARSIALSKNLYKYQKVEMNENALSLQIIESQIKRKRWHVESAVRNLGQFVTSSLRTQLDRIQSLDEIAGIKTSVVFKQQSSSTLV